MDKVELRKVQILRAALNAVAEIGYDLVTLQDIADHAGTSKGVISYYFENKNDVLSQLLEWITERIHKAELRAFERGGTFRELLKNIVDSIFSSAEENRLFYKVYLDFLARATRNERYQQINAMFYDHCLVVSNKLITVGQAEGLVMGHTAHDVFVVLRSLIDGCMIQWLQTGDDGLHSPYKDICFRAMLAYLTAPDG